MLPYTASEGAHLLEDVRTLAECQYYCKEHEGCVAVEVSIDGGRCLIHLDTDNIQPSHLKNNVSFHQFHLSRICVLEGKLSSSSSS